MKRVVLPGVGLCLVACASGPDVGGPRAVTPEARAEWHAKVTIAIVGCNGCADCRTAIRQTFAARSGAENVRLSETGGAVEIAYDEPREIRWRTLLEDPRASGLDKIRIVGAALAARGRIERVEGKRCLALPGTGQRIPLDDAVGPDLPEGTWVRVFGTTSLAPDGSLSSLRVLSAKKAEAAGGADPERISGEEPR